MLYLRFRSRLRLSLGAHGALLVVLLIPGGIGLAGLFDTFTTQWRFALPMFPAWPSTIWHGSIWFGFYVRDLGGLPPAGAASTVRLPARTASPAPGPRLWAATL
jgi:hypothetical protein